MLRFFSLLIRKLQSYKASRQVLHNFQQWKEVQQNLPPYFCKSKKLLIIRLDDIGDYLLSRNMLQFYKQGRWKDYEITLLGNDAWKGFFDELDNAVVDKVLWLNKKRFFESTSYRMEIWTELRKEGFEVVICPSRTRPLLLDDICMLATGALIKIASENTFVNKKRNRLSDNLYTGLYQTKKEQIHEFHFNQQFANWVCHTNRVLQRPEITAANLSIPSQHYILCFIGASVKSKRWPEKQWIQFIKLYKQKYVGSVIIAGGEADIKTANSICAETGAKSIAGSTSLKDMITYVCNANAVVTNDTMSVHLAASCNKSTIIIANGNKYYRFTEYGKAGINNITSIYPEAFTRKLNNKGDNLSEHYTAVTADIGTIKADKVFSRFVELHDNWKFLK